MPYNDNKGEDNDEFGIRKIYGDRDNSYGWSMNMDDFKDDEVEEDDNVDNKYSPGIKLKIEDLEQKNGYWTGKPVTSTDPHTFRVTVFSKSGLDPEETTKDHGEASGKGHMQDEKDWKNIEMTGFFRIKEPDVKDEEITMYARGGPHNDDTKQNQCWGTAYKPGIQFDAKATMVKEYYHKGGDGYSERLGLNNELEAKDEDEDDEDEGSIVDKWIGMKTVMYNDESDNKVKVEVYYDWLEVGDDGKPQNIWKELCKITDEGDTFTAAQGDEDFVVDNCNAEDKKEVITWGGPEATFRIDIVGRVDFKWLSIREIDPSNKLVTSS